MLKLNGKFNGGNNVRNVNKTHKGKKKCKLFNGGDFVL